MNIIRGASAGSSLPVPLLLCLSGILKYRASNGYTVKLSFLSYTTSGFKYRISPFLFAE